MSGGEQEPVSFGSGGGEGEGGESAYDAFRPTFKLGDWEPPEMYNQPQLEPDGEARTAEHKVLSDIPVVQKIGESAERYTLRGNCFEYQIRELREFRGETVRIRHPAKIGDVFVERTSFSSTSSFEHYLGRDRWVYTYTMELIEVA